MMQVIPEAKENLFLLLTKQPRPHIKAPLPVLRADGEPIGWVYIQELTAHECDEIAAECEYRLRKKFKDGGVPRKEEQSVPYTELYNQYSAEGVLFRSVRRIDNIESRFFPSIEDVAKYLSSDNMARLMNYYYTLMVNLSGALDELTPEKAEDWIEKLGRLTSANQAHFLESCSQAIQRALLKYMADQLLNLRNINKTSSAPAESLPEENKT